MKEFSQLLIFVLCIHLLLAACGAPDPNKAADGRDHLERNSVEPMDRDIPSQAFRDTVYLAAYSEIYSNSKLKTIPLSVTLSLRSGSFTDTTTINAITYYDTDGNILKQFIAKPVLLKPMQSIDYVVPMAALKTNESGEVKRGGTGAHFVIDWGADYDTQPIMQCVMHGNAGNNNSVSFVVSGKSISTRNVKR